LSGDIPAFGHNRNIWSNDMTIWRAIKTGKGVMIAILGVSHVTFAQASCTKDITQIPA
jgi:hypothetical protein